LFLQLPFLQILLFVKLFPCSCCFYNCFRGIVVSIIVFPKDDFFM
jgi:hypothetical protein